MHKKDYIQRRLEEFGKVMAVILGYKRLSDWEKFEKEIEEAVQKFTALDVNAVEQLSNESFNNEVLLHPTLTQYQKKILATLLFEKLMYYFEQEEETKAARLKDKCRLLYGHLYDNFTDNEFDLDVHYKLGFLNRT